MASKTYLLNESLDRIDTLLGGYSINTSDIVGGINCFRLPVAVTKNYCLVVADISYGFRESVPAFKERVYSALYNELYEISRGLEQLCCFKVVGKKLAVVFDTKQKSDVDRVIDAVANMCGIVDIINKKCRVSPTSNGFSIRVAIHYGTMTLLTYGEPRINTIGDDELMKETEGFFDKSVGRVIISSVIKNNIKEDYQSFFTEEVGFTPLFTGSIINTGMSNWLSSQNK